ncbi:hypothetical protein [Methyloceanibacter sp.]|uniref:hypothetical protein n=1 Tax=Methyloceanibacter sp. TaxID=1965321 RepID=UPI002084B972|nr:hypothetical protein [Methyloceanibacter sp.]GFO82235.1 MAG: hypothetical protein A49_18620 [Methyloceanibacter sp.]HML93729.1 hypothetical protein [Methyloceanibacter sp.]
MIRRFPKRTFAAVLALAALCGSWLVFAAYMNKGRCVVLPNGYKVGHVSVFRFKPDFQFDMLLRDPQGKILMRTDNFIRFYRDPKDTRRVDLQYPGGTLNMVGVEMMPLIWDEGNVQQYGRKWNEPRPAPDTSLSIIITNFLLVYNRLKRSGQFEMVGCGTPWFDVGETTRRYCLPGDCL